MGYSYDLDSGVFPVYGSYSDTDEPIEFDPETLRRRALLGDWDRLPESLKNALEAIQEQFETRTTKIKAGRYITQLCPPKWAEPILISWLRDNVSNIYPFLYDGDLPETAEDAPDPRRELAAIIRIADGQMSGMEDRGDRLNRLLDRLSATIYPHEALPSLKIRVVEDWIAGHRLQYNPENWRGPHGVTRSFRHLFLTVGNFDHEWASVTRSYPEKDDKDLPRFLETDRRPALKKTLKKEARAIAADENDERIEVFTSRVLEQVRVGLDQEGLGFSRGADETLRELIFQFIKSNADHLAPLDDEVSRDISVVVEAHVTVHKQRFCCGGSLEVSEGAELERSLKHLKASVYHSPSFVRAIDREIWRSNVQEVLELSGSGGTTTTSSSSSASR